MKEALLALLQKHPAAAGSPTNVLDDLADDLQAMIIRALVTPGVGDPQVIELEHRVNDVFNSVFGATLHNLIHHGPDFGARKALYYIARNFVTRATIQAMLLEFDNWPDRFAVAPVVPVRSRSEKHADLLRRRLSENQPNGKVTIQ